MLEEHALYLPHSVMEEPEESSADSYPVLPEFYLADTALCNFNILELSFKTHLTLFTSGSIHRDPTDRAHSYVSKIRALLDKHIREGGMAGQRESIHCSKTNFFQTVRGNKV